MRDVSRSRLQSSNTLTWTQLQMNADVAPCLPDIDKLVSADRFAISIPEVVICHWFVYSLCLLSSRELKKIKIKNLRWQFEATSVVADISHFGQSTG